ncbi:histidine kinase [Streptomyces sp. NBC_00193]|uniref:sensor histidine kinase n=1 Tax=Streptomyces sp. NBC_00193 TaxID=2975675 RepID=UPI00225372A5|nr:histidine kinase [Streptomyces sp. NBC_00193]MCX5297536.1 histidine kinase [Streptomyces sp. NBC_00193]
MGGAGGQGEAVVAGVLRERHRLAAELHDTVAQGLTSMHLLLDAADREWTREPGQARLLVRQAAAAARENLAEARRLIHDLAPVELERAALADVLRELCAGVDGARFRLEGEPRAVPGRVEAAVLRAAQGALANVRRHARASAVVVTLTYQPYVLALDVWDDGVGFDPAAVAAAATAGRPGGDGLRLLRRRIAYLGGTATVESSPGGGGTVVSVCLPAPGQEPGPGSGPQSGPGSGPRSSPQAGPVPRPRSGPGPV